MADTSTRPMLMQRVIMTAYATASSPFDQSFLSFATEVLSALTTDTKWPCEECVKPLRPSWWMTVLPSPSAQGSYSCIHLLGYRCFTAEGLA